MQFVRPNCENCVCKDVCSIKADVDLFKNDLQNMEFYNGKRYADILSPLSIHIECKHYMDAEIRKTIKLNRN